MLPRPVFSAAAIEERLRTRVVHIDNLEVENAVAPSDVANVRANAQSYRARHENDPIRGEPAEDDDTIDKAEATADTNTANIVDAAGAAAAPYEEDEHIAMSYVGVAPAPRQDASAVLQRLV